MLRRVVNLSLIAALAAAALARAETWVVGEGSEVVFTSKAPMESFDGKTRKVAGRIVCAAEDLAGPLELRIEVDLASLDTGIGMRNTHMRERHLETDTYPLAVFTGESVVAATEPALVPGRPVELTVRGVFELHGVARPRDIAARVTLAEDGTLAVEAGFPVSLADHAIDRPQFLVMKLADEQQVRVRLQARPEGP